MSLHDAGGYSGNVGRPFGEFFVPPAYGVSFFNKMIDEPLEELDLTSISPSLFNYDEDLGDVNLKYSRVLHFSVFEGASGEIIEEDSYLPYVDSVSVSGETTTFHVKPLVEVINPTFHQINSSTFVVYFFSNFTTHNLPEKDVYTDDPKYLRRMVEFATNEPNELAGKSPSGMTGPLPNDRNYYDADVEEDDTPRIAFLSAVVRVQVSKAKAKSGSSTSAPSTSSGAKLKVFAIAEKPSIITWIGHRFCLDNHPPLLVNKTQSIEWAADKAASDSLDDDAVNDDPPRQIPYHHLVSKIETVMYPGYSGINFYTRSITDIYDLALDHFFDVAGSVSKSFDMVAHGRKLKSIGIRQKNLVSLEDSDFSPFERHFGILEIDDDDFRPFSSSSSSSSSSIISYEVKIPASVNLQGDDKPEFWMNYWDICGSSSSASGGSIVVDFIGDGSWYGEACVGNVTMYAKLEERPYGFYNNSLMKFWLTFGPLTSAGVELDIVWQGYFISGADGAGDYIRYYSLGDDAPTTIELSIAD